MNRAVAGLLKMFGARKRDIAASDMPGLGLFDEAASKDDILACFRLLLGRHPNAEEWTGHMSHAGDPLKLVVASYLTSLEFSRRGLTRETAPDIVVSDLPDFKIFSDVNDSAVGKFVRENVYEHDVTAVFRALLRPGMGVLDIGANIGYFTMLSASIVGREGHVFAVEPNHQNARLLEASRRLNQFEQVTVLPVAAAAEVGILALTTSHSTGTTSTLPEQIDTVLQARVVPGVPLDRMIPVGKRIDLIKIDVDGAEYTAMLGCREIVERFRPVIISEFAPALLPGISNVEGEDYLRWFGSHEYELSVIQPDGSVLEMGQRWPDVMEAYHQRGIDHIDILARPKF